MTEGSAFTLTRRIIFAMLAGGVVGIGINMANGDVGGIAGFLQSVIVEGLFGTVGQIFVTALKMLVVPLVFVSLVCGVVSLGDVHALGRIGVKTVRGSLYFFHVYHFIDGMNPISPAARTAAITPIPVVPSPLWRGSGWGRILATGPTPLPA